MLHKKLLTIAKNDKKITVRATTILKLASTGDTGSKGIVYESIKDRSYKVIVAGILGLINFSPEEGIKNC